MKTKRRELTAKLGSKGDYYQKNDEEEGGWR